MKFFRKTNKLTENKRPNNTTKKIINLPNRVFNFITNSYSSIYIKNIIYQPKLDMSLKELDSWIMDELEKLSTKPNVKLNRINYWRFIEKKN